MPRTLIAYSTVDGHTRKISEKLGQTLEAAGHAVTLAELGDEASIDQGPFDPRQFDLIVIGASIRYGKYRPALFEFIESNRDALETRRTAFFSVNLVARKPEKQTPETNPYIVKTFRKNTTWNPDQMAVFAGKVDYARYGFWDRQIIRMIMWMTHGPTDRSAKIEYTDWEAVDAFARSLSKACSGSG